MKLYRVRLVLKGQVKYLSGVYPTGGTARTSKDSRRAMLMTEGEFNNWVKDESFKYLNADEVILEFVRTESTS